MAAEAEPPVLEITDYGKTYGAEAVLKGVSFSISRGEVVGLLGPNGAGKSTLIKALTGIIDADTGSVRFKGAEVKNLAGNLEVGVIHQDFGVIDEMTVLENMRLGVPPLRAVGPLLSLKREREAVRRALDRVSLDVSPDALAGTLAPAERAIMAVARMLDLGGELPDPRRGDGEPLASGRAASGRHAHRPYGRGGDDGPARHPQALGDHGVGRPGDRAHRRFGRARLGGEGAGGGDRHRPCAGRGARAGDRGRERVRGAPAIDRRAGHRRGRARAVRRRHRPGRTRDRGPATRRGGRLHRGGQLRHPGHRDGRHRTRRPLYGERVVHASARVALLPGNRETEGSFDDLPVART